MIIYHFNANDDNLITKYATDQWEFQDPKMEVPYYIRPYFVGMFPYIGQKHRPYKWKVPPIHRFLLHGHWTDHDDQQLINPQSNQALGPWLHPFPRDAHRGCTPVGGSSKMSKMMGYNISHHAFLGYQNMTLGEMKGCHFRTKAMSILHHSSLLQPFNQVKAHKIRGWSPSLVGKPMAPPTNNGIMGTEPPVMCQR